MLTLEQNYIISSIRAVLIDYSEEKVGLNTPNQEKRVSKDIKKNGILLTVYKQLSLTLQTVLKSQFSLALKQSIIQNYEGEHVLHTLSDAGLSCIALKGWELRKPYPDITMRQMADLDILVRPYDFVKIKSVMEKMGFSAGCESSWKHDSFKKNEVHVEMHKRLTDDSDLIQIWEKGIWDRAEAVEENIYRMSQGGFYIFHFIHLHKDFMNGSLGLRRIVDTWLLQQNSDVNMSVVRDWLESFNMWKFHNNMIRLSRATMSNDPIDEDSEVLLSHAFMHGIYGSEKSYKAGRIVSMGGGLKRGKCISKIAGIFLPYKRMKAHFEILEKWPILLPFCWIKRIFRSLKDDLKKKNDA